MTATPAILMEDEPANALQVQQPAALSTVGSALAAQVQATVAARYMVAMQRPRDWETVRQRMLAECRRPGFAEQARYRKPIGGGKFIEGESIRFAEAAARNMGNIATEVIAVDEDADTRTLRVVTTDIESNTSFSTDLSIKKTVERRNPREGQTVISSRRNSNGDIVHLVEASEDEILTKTGNLISKATRNNVLRLLPGDIVDDCMAQCLATLAKGAKEDPVAARRKLLDAFGFFEIMPNHVAEYLGHDVNQISPQELEDLRKVYAGVKSGETSWAQVMAAKAEAIAKDAPSSSKSAAEKVREKVGGQA